MRPSLRLLSCLLLFASLAWPAAAWDGPVSGPPAQHGRKVWFIAEDYRNGGITGVLRAFGQAAQALQWQVNSIDAKGELHRLRQLMTEALAAQPDAIVLGGFQTDKLQDLVRKARQQHILLAGWHAGPLPAPPPGLVANISTDPATVARLAVHYAVASSAQPVGAVIITDMRFDIARAKVQAMQAELAHCKHCTLLAIENVPIHRATQDSQPLVQRLNQRFGKRWTHTLAINDIYFDEMNFPLRQQGRTDIRNIAAGDGSRKAISRVRSALSQQIATIAEPLDAQGWQLADELNRAFAGKAPSGHISQPVLITRDQAPAAANISDDGYRQAYLRIWQGLH